MGGRPENLTRTVTITISTTPQVKRALEKLVRTGYYGKNPADAAERIIAQRLASSLNEQRIIEHRKS